MAIDLYIVIDHLLWYPSPFLSYQLGYQETVKVVL